jgi:hypothetical protein
MRKECLGKRFRLAYQPREFKRAVPAFTPYKC